MVLFSSTPEQKESLCRLFTFKAKRQKGLRSVLTPLLWKRLRSGVSSTFAPAQHVSDSSASRFLSLSELNLDFLSSQQRELHIISHSGQAIRKGVETNTNWLSSSYHRWTPKLQFPTLICIYLFYSSSTRSFSAPSSALTWSLWIRACRKGGGEKKKIKIHQLMSRLVMK